MEENLLYESKGVQLQVKIRVFVTVFILVAAGIFLFPKYSNGAFLHLKRGGWLRFQEPFNVIMPWIFIAGALFLVASIIDSSMRWIKIYSDHIEGRPIKLFTVTNAYCPIADVRSLETSKNGALIVHTVSGKYLFQCNDPKHAAEVLKPLIPQ